MDVPIQVRDLFLLLKQREGRRTKNRSPEEKNYLTGVLFGVAGPRFSHVESFRVRCGWQVMFHDDVLAEGDPQAKIPAGWFPRSEFLQTIHGSWEKKVINDLLAKAAQHSEVSAWGVGLRDRLRIDRQKSGPRHQRYSRVAASGPRHQQCSRIYLVIRWCGTSPGGKGSSY